MPAEDLVEKVKRYRLAVHAYCDAVDHMDSTIDLGLELRQTEAAREEAEHARSALLGTRAKAFVAAQGWGYGEVTTDHGTEDWVLGDVGQHGG